MAMLPEYLQVDKNFFLMYISWANENVSGFHSQSVMVASRVNYMDGSDKVLAYACFDYGEFFYIRRDVMKNTKEAD